MPIPRWLPHILFPQKKFLCYTAFLQEDKNIFSSAKIRYALIAVIGFLLYAKTLFYGFTYLDDNVWLQDYGWLLKHASNAAALFTNPDLVSGVFYRPLLSLSFMMDAQWAGDQLLPYHLTNILIHILNSCLVFHLFKKLGYDERMAFVFALIFTVHPALTQAVVWIPGRTDSFLALWILLSFLFFINFLNHRKWPDYFFHVLFWIAALLVKETAIALPVLCALYWFLIFRGHKDQRKLALFFFVWGLLAAALFIVRKQILPESALITKDAAVATMVENIPSFISYLGKIIFPFNLSVLPINADTRLIGGWLALAALSLSLSVSRAKRMNYIFFGIMWFVVFLTPSLLLSFINHEYRLYLPILGILIVLLEADVFKRALASRNLKWIFVALIACLAVKNLVYSGEFKNRWAFWNNAVKNSPHSPLAHRNLGAMMHLSGQLEKAEAHYKEALKLNPQEKMVHNNLGLIHVNRGEFVEAEREYKQEIMMNPAYDNVYYNLGVLYLQTGRPEEAEASWKAVVKINPNFVDVYAPLALLYIHQKRYTEADASVKELQKRGVVAPAGLSEILLRQGFH